MAYYRPPIKHLLDDDWSNHKSLKTINVNYLDDLTDFDLVKNLYYNYTFVFYNKKLHPISKNYVLNKYINNNIPLPSYAHIID